MNRFTPLKTPSAGRPQRYRFVVLNTPCKRLHGLLGRRSLMSGAGVILISCRSVHTCGMRMPIDVVFVDAALRITQVTRGLVPWRAAASRRARHAVEMLAGAAPGTVAEWHVWHIAFRRALQGAGMLVAPSHGGDPHDDNPT
ncbi:DUF192 domain-containing protein [Alcaligenaceae bacterium A4P071]|nr:DUF192 domain-containing protein [Alcaligenaceae bacterium B3P038]MDQ2184428.1 DUF192 domain-containing protein [Alcaligenaceae bacterium A4P071]